MHMCIPHIHKHTCTPYFCMNTSLKTRSIELVTDKISIDIFFLLGVTLPTVEIELAKKI